MTIQSAFKQTHPDMPDYNKMPEGSYYLEIREEKKGHLQLSNLIERPVHPQECAEAEFYFCFEADEDLTHTGRIWLIAVEDEHSALLLKTEVVNMLDIDLLKEIESEMLNYLA